MATALRSFARPTQDVLSFGCAPEPLEKEYAVVSMFSGCGGMDLGFSGGFKVFGRSYKRLPFRVVWANELNPAACRTYRRNLGTEIICEDIWKVIDTMPSRADVVIGGFPCQDVSVNGKRIGINGKRTGLYRAMLEGIRKTRPKVFVAENVKGLLMKHHHRAIHQVVEDFEALGYTVTYQLYLASHYGVPQTRERVFIVGTSAECKAFVPPPRPSQKVMTAKQAISDLEKLEECSSINHVWSRANRSPEQGNRQLKADRPAYTIRAECHGNIQYHYRLPRRISMREAARFQSFPDTFIFDSKLRETERQVGNAVPPVLAWHVAKAVYQCLENDEAEQVISA
ncbi:MAG TPA: DNA cytosine methyltransferase [Terriglobales bacterium]|jgi:DNA (cytosine-5)-methyltransferase 1|nr:DNA cytosine methyltransferase [Terriglobales bacterium]